MRTKLNSRGSSLAAAFLLLAVAPAAGRAQSSSLDLRPGQGKIALARAESAYKAAAYPLAADLYEWVVTHDNPPASIAIFRLATLRSWDNKLEEATGLYRRYIKQEPWDAEGSL